MSFLLNLTDPAAIVVARTGGKGASLAALTQRALPVPAGVVVTTDAYRAFVAALPDDAWAGVRAASADDLTALRAACERLRRALGALPLPAALDGELRAWVAEWAARGTAAFAVRSSATAEDTAGAAFAGQHDTFLDCRGADDVAARVKACWLSLWDERAVAYRARVGVPHDGVAMAVVVQEMADCDVAGVAFTLDPLTGALDRMVVSANFGLGESVVGGEGDADHFALDRRTCEVVEARVASKRARVVATGHGTVVEHVSAREGARRTLSDADLCRLGALLDRVERGAPHRWPQDVEWGMRGGELVLLQSRPVTVVPPRWTRDESAERFPNAVTPFAWDFVEEGFHRSLAHSLELMGLPPFAGKWFALFDHYVYGDQSAVELYARAAAPELPAGGGDLASSLPALVRRYAWLRRLPHEWHAALPRYLAAVDSLRAEPLDERRSAAELWDYVERVSAVGSEYFLPNIAISLGHGLLHRSLGALLASLLGDAEGARLTADLTACETQTARVNAELRALAAQAAADPDVERALRTRDSRAVLRDADRAGRRAASPFWRALDAFVNAHGHRETDFDPYHPTWAEAPWVVLDHVRAMLDAPAAAPASDTVERLRRAEAELDGLPRRVRPFALELARLARAYTALDDLEHYHTTRLALPLRRGVRALGARVARAGLIAEPMDLFFARREVLAAAAASGPPGAGVAAWRELADAVARGKAAYARDRVRTPAWELGRTVRDEAAAASGALRGVAGSPGVAEGVVFAVRSPEDFARFPRGAILVARTTNPAWTPLFYGAAAVVTESGGPLSHGAVTAREMRIPAVMGVRAALDALPDGTRVRVDGSSGTVEILDPSRPPRPAVVARPYTGGRDHVVTILS